MASIATEMFVGRERFATLLLMRLTETVILWLSEDQSFWEDIEEGPKPLGPLGLQQVKLFFLATFFFYRSICFSCCLLFIFPSVVLFGYAVCDPFWTWPILVTACSSSYN